MVLIQLGPQSQQGTTVARKTLPVGRNLELIQTAVDRHLPKTRWGEKVERVRDHSYIC